MPGWRDKLFSSLMQWRLRPWPLLTPVLVLLAALPLLRPLRHAESASTSESVLLASVDALSSGRVLTLDPDLWRDVAGTTEVGGRVYADRPPTYAVLLSGPAWLLRRLGFDFGSDTVLPTYLLTMIGATLPVAVGGAILYRMGRLFELPRPTRALLAAVCVFGSGYFSYATVLNPHALAGTLFLGACAAIVRVAHANSPGRSLPVLTLAGGLLALAVAVDPWTLPIVLPMPLAVLAMKLPWSTRLIGVLFLTLGAIPAGWLHCAWSISAFESVLAPSSLQTLREVAGIEPASVATAGERMFDFLGRLLTVTVGQHGLLTHFPLLLASLVGLVLVMRKHWPGHTKVLAAICFVAVLCVLSLSGRRDAGLGGASFALQWMTATAPVLAFWLGVLLRRRLGRWTGTAIATAAAVSVVIGVAGASAPIPRVPYDTHTALGAMRELISGNNIAAGHATGDP